MAQSPSKEAYQKYRFLHEYEGSTAESCPRRDSGKAKGWMSSGADRV